MNKSIEKKIDGIFNVLGWDIDAAIGTPDPQHIGDENDKEDKIKKLEERIKYLKMNEALAKKVNNLNADLDSLEDDMISGAKIARAVCELQEEMNRRFNDVYIINKLMLRRGWDSIDSKMRKMWFSY